MFISDNWAIQRQDKTLEDYKLMYTLVSTAAGQTDAWYFERACRILPGDFFDQLQGMSQTLAERYADLGTNVEEICNKKSISMMGNDDDTSRDIRGEVDLLIPGVEEWLEQMVKLSRYMVAHYVQEPRPAKNAFKSLSLPEDDSMFEPPSP